MKAPERSRQLPLGLPHQVDDVVAWSAFCPVIDPGRILRLHGYKDPGKVRPVIRQAAAAIAMRAVELVAVQGRWRRVAIVSLADGELRLAGGTALTCPAFDRLLANADQVVVFVLTLGARFDEAIAELSEKSAGPLDALFTETAGRLAIEKLTRVLARDLGRGLAQEGRTLGTRMGPGYSYRASSGSSKQRVMWPLEQQTELFGLFQSAALPVELMSSSVMRPKMSRSGLFGISRELVSGEW